MLIEGPSVQPGARLGADVCIVGAGPAGITLALALVRSGLDVCLLESGAAQPRRRYQRLAAGSSAGHPYFPLGSTRLRAFGGTANHWLPDVGLRARPLDAVDLEARPEVPHSGWPITREELDPFYRRAHEVCRLGPYRYGPESWALEDRRTLELPAERVETSIFQLGPLETFPSYLEELAGAATVLLESTVVGIATTDHRVSELQVATLDGNHFSVSAEAFVLATGGIENARLLLATGLGNRSGLVGRFFMEHPTLASGILRPADPALVEGLGLYRVHQAGEVRLEGTLCLPEEVVRREGLLNLCFVLRPAGEAWASPAVQSLRNLRWAPRRRPLPPHLAGHLGNVLRQPHRVLASVHHRLTGGRPPTLLGLAVRAEQAPDPDSRVVLSNRRDAFGMPLPRLEWRLGRSELRSIRRSQDLLGEALEEAGLGRLERRLGEERPPAHVHGQWHHMGTTRMHRDPSHGVVDPDGRLHQLDNLYLAGSSVFPTGGYANPTLTIVALAIRLADHLGKLLR